MGHTYIGIIKQIISLALKGRFYANAFFVSKGKILCQVCRFIPNGRILCCKVWHKIITLVCTMVRTFKRKFLCLPNQIPIRQGGLR